MTRGAAATRRAALALAVLPALVGAAAACESDFPLQGRAGPVAAALRPAPAKIPVGEIFALDIVLCRTDGTAVPVLSRLDATMPAHRHGMNYKPSLVASGPGRWRADGLMFHMPGRWEIRLDTADGATLRLPVDIP